jgi:hypothetical protein
LDALDSLVGKIVKAVYTDAGETKIRKGRLIAADASLIVVESYTHTYAIPRGQLMELKTLESAGGREDDREQRWPE